MRLQRFLISVIILGTFGFCFGFNLNDSLAGWFIFDTTGTEYTRADGDRVYDMSHHGWEGNRNSGSYVIPTDSGYTTYRSPAIEVTPAKAGDFGNNDYTLFARVYYRGSTGHFQKVIMKDGAVRYYKLMAEDTTGHHPGVPSFGDTAGVIYAQDTLSIGWHTLAGVRQGRMKYFYIDGVLVDSMETNIMYSTFSGNHLHFAYDSGTDYGRFMGTFSNVRIYNRALDPAEIAELNKDVVGHWDFEEGSGDSLRDKSGYPLHGRIDGATWASGFEGNSALSFDGNDSVVIADSTSYRLRIGIKPKNKQVTLATIVKADTLLPYATILTTSKTTWDSGFGLAHFNGVGNTVSFFVNDTNTRATASIVPGAWTRLVGTYDGSYLRLYVDDAIADSVSYTNPIPYKNDGLRIGSGWVGKIDDTRIYSGKQW